MGRNERPEHIMTNFSLEDQEKIRAYLFTNPHGRTGFVYPQPLVAGEEISPLMSAYSRTHVPFQDRVLEFLDQEKAEQVKAFMPLIDANIDIFRNPDGTLKVSKKTMSFNKNWVLKHGHSSIKEETQLLGYAEQIADITGKKITGHPLNKPQVKSTRYISYGSVLDGAMADVDLASLENSGMFFEQIDALNNRYMDAKGTLAARILASGQAGMLRDYLRSEERVTVAVLKRAEAEQQKNPSFELTQEKAREFREGYLASVDDESLTDNVDKFVLDYVRVYLPAATKTSLGFSADVRTLEGIITGMISSPREEDRERGYELWDEAKKVAPVLLGEKSHVNEDPWQLYNETELRAEFEERFKGIPIRNNGHPTVNLITPKDMAMYTDRFNAALAIFPLVDASLTDIYNNITGDDVSWVLRKVHEKRGEYDVIHPSIGHGGLMPELVMGYHGYRDMFRHRRGSRSVQLLTTRLGFEVPEIFRTFGMEEQYAADMEQAAMIFEEARAQSPHKAEKLVPFGALCRALHSWQVDQMGYVGALRSDISKGNVSYVMTTREMMRQVADLMPQTAEFFKFDQREYPLDLWKRGYAWYDATQREQ